MRKLIVSEFMTLDGVMEAPGGEPSHPHTGWVADFHSPEFTTYKFNEIVEAETLLVGRVTYESFAEAWPARDGEFADRMNAMPKLVASTTLTDPDWKNTTVLEGDVVEAIRAEKAEDGGPILVAGSCTLVHTLLGANLVDELRLMVFPVTVGSGLKVFPQTPEKATFELVECQSLPTGVLTLSYRAV